MDFMEQARIALGYPIRGVNTTTISQDIGEECVNPCTVLGDKPSNEIVLAIILSLFRVKDHVKEVLDHIIFNIIKTQYQNKRKMKNNIEIYTSN